MTRFLPFATLVASVLSVLAAAGQQQPTFRTLTDTVRVFVTVTDRDGRLNTTLKREDFEVRDEGQLQPLTQFDNKPQPIRLVIMLDVSTSMEANLPVLRSAASELFTRLRPEDGVRVGTFGKQILITPSFAHDADELRSALPTVIAPDAPTALWLALDQAMTTFEGPDERRPVILVLSDGHDSQSLRERQLSEAEVVERARREDVMIYAVGMRSRTSGMAPPPDWGVAALPRFPQVMVPNDVPDPGLARVAQETGGGYTEIRLEQDLAAAFARVAEELHGQYLLGFEPPKRDGKVHRIDVRIAQGGMNPRGRRSYVAPQP